jgi:hypothetical protein
VGSCTFEFDCVKSNTNQGRNIDTWHLQIKKLKNLKGYLSRKFRTPGVATGFGALRVSNETTVACKGMGNSQE